MIHISEQQFIAAAIADLPKKTSKKIRKERIETAVQTFREMLRKHKEENEKPKIRPRKRFIAICTTSLGQVSIEWASVLRALGWPLNTGYVNFFTKDTEGGEIAEGRNRCVELALSYETEDRYISELFWLDDDVIAHPLVLLKLLSHNRPIASGCFFTRCTPSEPLIFPGRGCGTTPFVPDQAFETWGTHMGLTLVRPEVYRKMVAELDLGTDKYGRPCWYKTTGAEHTTFEDGVLWQGGTEDLWMLDLASKVGYTDFVDTSRMAFGWHVDHKTGIGYPEKQYQQRCRGETIVWETSEGPKTWE